MLSFLAYLTENEERIKGIVAKHSNLDFSHDPSARMAFGHLANASEALIKHFAAHDPSTNKQYTQWMVNRYKVRDFYANQTRALGQHLWDYHQHKQFLAPEHRDINKLNVEQMYNAADAAKTKKSKKQLKKEAKNDGATLVHKDGDFTVHQIHTHAAAVLYGKGSKWCTSSDNNAGENHFNNYHGQGPLVVVHNGDKKYQVHFPSRQFNDSRNSNFGISHFLQENPKARKVKAFKDQAAKHGFEDHFMEPHD